MLKGMYAFGRLFHAWRGRIVSMERSEMLRQLRIGFSAVTVVLCVLRLVLPLRILPIAFCVLLSAIIWTPWANRFSLRTLFLAVTLVALVVGFSVYLTSN
jgi:hypothetical protein